MITFPRMIEIAHYGKFLVELESPTKLLLRRPQSHKFCWCPKSGLVTVGVGRVEISETLYNSMPERLWAFLWDSPRQAIPSQRPHDATAQGKGGV